MKDTLITVLIAALVMLGIAAASYHTGCMSTERKYKSMIAEANLAHEKVYAELEKTYRQQEKDHAEKLAEIDKTYSEKLKNVESKNTHTLGLLRNRTLRLRERFSCENTAQSVSGAGSTRIVGHGAGGSGLRIEDAEFLVSEAARADAVVVQLQACQAIVSADRQLQKE